MPSILAQSVTFARGRFFELFYIAVQNLVDQARFPRAGYAGDADEHAQRNFDVDIFQIVGARAFDLDRRAAPASLRLRAGNGIVLRWLRYAAVSDSSFLQQLLVGTRRT